MANNVYSVEKKNEVMELLNAGFKPREIAEQTGVGESTIYFWRKSAEDKNKRGYTSNDIHRSLVELADVKDLTPYIGKEITKMSLRDIIAFLRLLGVNGKLSVELPIKL